MGLYALIIVALIHYINVVGRLPSLFIWRPMLARAKSFGNVAQARQVER